MALNTLLVRVVVPTTAVGLAMLAEAKGWGLFHVFGLPSWAAVVLRRRAARSRHLPAARAGARCAGACGDCIACTTPTSSSNVTTGARFHPIEILLSMVLKMMVITALGAARRGGAHLRGAAQCDGHVQSLERAHPARDSIECCAWSW